MTSSGTRATPAPTSCASWGRNRRRGGDPGDRHALGTYGWETFAGYVERRQATGTGVVLDAYADAPAARLYWLGNTLLLDTGALALGNDAWTAPRRFWSGYDVDLGGPVVPATPGPACGAATSWAERARQPARQRHPHGHGRRGLRRSRRGRPERAHAVAGQRSRAAPRCRSRRPRPCRRSRRRPPSPPRPRPARASPASARRLTSRALRARGPRGPRSHSRGRVSPARSRRGQRVRARDRAAQARREVGDGAPRQGLRLQARARSRATSRT